MKEFFLLMDKKTNYAYLVVIFLIFSSYITYARIIGNDFINFDDNSYITENSHIQSGINVKNIKWVFTAVVASNWHPLTLLSHMMDCSLFGANASGHHLVSLLLHIGAVIFLFLFLYKTTNNIWPAAFAATFFAIHPLRVESVAWVAERKDVLSMFFGMACLYAYAFYAESSKLSKYILCLILFVLTLMSKPMLVTLPFILLLLDYWPLGRWEKSLSAPVESRYQLAGRLVWEKTPFFLLTIASSMVTFWAQNKGGSVVSLELLPFLKRLNNAIVSYIAYLEKTIWPVNLAVIYPYDLSLLLWKVLISGIMLTVITLAVLYYIKKLPFLFTGWFWYVGTLIPVIGLVQVGEQAMTDRYTYLPSIGIAIMLSWSIPLLFPRKDISQKIIFLAGLVVLVILSVLTWRQCGYWRNSIELFTHTLQVTKNNYKANRQLGYAYGAIGQYQQAIDNFSEVIRLKPNYYMPYSGRGIAYIYLGQYKRAIEDFNKAISLQPIYTNAYNYRGKAYSDLGQYQQAIEDYSNAIRLKPNYAEAYNNRGIAYFHQGNNELGCRDAKKACDLGGCSLSERAKNKGYCR